MRGHVYVGSLTVETDGEEHTVVKNFHRSFDSLGGMQAAFKDAGLSSRIGLVGCGAQKSLERCKAKDLYTSNLFRAARAYAEATCARWYILSAKYGLLGPERVIEPYDLRLHKEGAVGWGRRVGRQLNEVLPHSAMANATIVCLAGRPYSEAIDLGDREFYWEEPLRGLGLGKRIQWLRENTPR
jgi:hypothetical protein